MQEGVDRGVEISILNRGLTPPAFFLGLKVQKDGFKGEQHGPFVPYLKVNSGYLQLNQEPGSNSGMNKRRKLEILSAKSLRLRAASRCTEK